MTKETLCTYEQSNRLKRLGFDLPCWCSYEYSETGRFPFCANKEGNYNAHPFTLSAPTQDDAHRWLRDTMKILIVINPQKNTEGEICYGYSIFYLEDISPIGWSYELCKNYEEAMLHALDYAIECAVIQYRKQNQKK